MRIDDRCNFPTHPNPKTDTPTGVYRVARQDPAQVVTRIPDGTQVELTCYTDGQAIIDAVGNDSSLWLGVLLPDEGSGFIPDVDIGGGYTDRQLAGLGLQPCQ
ncbi:MAG TPA: hypothetical protein VFX70_03405 [Mycobacteriales bacterium]|nr:hypothetical protein [Mycobacteriales bacterium]